MTEKEAIKNPLFKEGEIKFPSIYYIDDFAYFMIDFLFDIEPVFLSDLSELSDFEIFNEIPGHERINFLDIPEEDRLKYYPDYLDWPQDQLEITEVRYPPITDDDWVKINAQRRIKHLKLIESKFEISMKDYPDDEKLLVWKVAHYVQYKLKMKQFTELSCC
jgi:hypothetical protein